MFMFHMGLWSSFELTMVEADILCSKEEEQGGSSDRYADMYGYRLDLSENPFLLPCCPGARERKIRRGSEMKMESLWKFFCFFVFV